MKKTRLSHVLTALQRSPGPAHERDAADFWEDFKARARYYPQVETAEQPRYVGRPGWITALASAIILLSAAGSYFLRSTPAGGQAIQINSLEVIASHSGVLIMEDEPSQGTIVWIMDMENNET